MVLLSRIRRDALDTTKNVLHPFDDDDYRCRSGDIAIFMIDINVIVAFHRVETILIVIIEKQLESFFFVISCLLYIHMFLHQLINYLIKYVSLSLISLSYVPQSSYSNAIAIYSPLPIRSNADVTPVLMYLIG